MEKCKSCGLEYGKPTFCSNKFHRIPPIDIPEQQELTFLLACNIESAFDINYMDINGECKPINAYEIESQLTSMLRDMNCIITKLTPQDQEELPLSENCDLYQSDECDCGKYCQYGQDKV